VHFKPLNLPLTVGLLQGEDDESDGEDDESSSDSEDDMHPGMDEELVDTQRLYGELMDDGPGDMMLNGDRDIDDLMQRVLENPNFQSDMAEMMQGDEEGHQVLSLLVPGSRVANTRFLHDIFQDMQLVRYPPRGGRGGMGDTRNLPSLLHEVPSTDHPLLSRRLEPSWRAGRGGSRASASDMLSQGHGHILMEDPTGPLSGATSFFRRDGRFLFRVQGDVPQAPNGDDGRSAALSSRWTDDGVGLSAGTRGVLASNLEDMLTAALTQNVQENQQAHASSAEPSAAAAEANVPSTAASSAAASLLQRSNTDLTAIQQQLQRVNGDIEMLVRDIQAVSNEARQQSVASSAAAEPASSSAPAEENQAQAAEATVGAAAATDNGGDAMEEDDEFEAALRLSMDPGALQEASEAQAASATNADQAASGEAEEAGSRPEASNEQPAAAAAPEAAAASVASASSIDPVGICMHMYETHVWNPTYSCIRV
jgi:hypothetical protein